MEDKSEVEEATFKGLILPNGPAKKLVTAFLFTHLSHHFYINFCFLFLG